MMRKRRYTGIRLAGAGLAAGIMVFAGGSAAAAAAAAQTELPQEARVPVWVYMLDNCGGCSANDQICNVCYGETQYRKELMELLTENDLLDQVEFRMYNIFFSVNRENLWEVMGVEEEPKDMMYPAAFVGGTMLMGEDEIAARLADTIRSEASAADTDQWLQREPEISAVTVPDTVYFTMEGCGDCEKLSAWLDEKDAELSGQIYEHMSFYQVGDEIPGSWEMLEKTYILYGREQESLWVPTILAGDQCLIGEDEIMAYFEDYEPLDDHGTIVPKDFE